MSSVIDEKVVAGAKDPNIVKENPIVALTEKVDQLYLFRDHYFESHEIDDAVNKNANVEKEMKDTLSKFDECKGYEIDGARAKYYYLKGKALNVVERYIPQAEELLSKSVKLDPKLIEAWNELGECYWKNNDLVQAKNCFSGALLHSRNKVSLRNLSMVMRQESFLTFEERVNNIKQGIEYAKEAVSLDTTDGVSWTILGNSYMSSYFTISQNPAILRHCISAYLQAEKDPVARGNTELYYNKAVVLKHQENYQTALESLRRSMSLDPNWDKPRTKHESLLKYLIDVQKSIDTKGKVKPKKLQQMIQSLDKKHLGPYADGSYTSGTQTVTLKLASLNELVPGINIEKVVLGRVVCWIQEPEYIPFTFCMVDKDQTCVAVTIYNLAQGKGVTIGDSVAIPEPILTRHSFKHSDHTFEFKSIRVETPVILVLNGRKLGRDQEASIKLLTFNKND